MVNMTLAIPPKLNKLMKKHKDVKWAEVARFSMWKRAKDLELLDKLTAKNTMTMDDVMELDKIIKKATWKRIEKDIQ